MHDEKKENKKEKQSEKTVFLELQYPTVSC